MGLFQKVKTLLRMADSYEQVELHGEMRLQGKGIQIPFQGIPIQITLGSKGKCLQLYPERFLNSTQKQPMPCFILFDPERYFSDISGFIRLQRGEKLVLDKNDPEQKIIFDYSKKVSNRHLAITNAGDILMFKDLHSDSGTTLAPLAIPETIDCLLRRRREKLLRIRNIFGGPIQPLPPAQALSLLREVNSILAEEAYRPENSKGKPGAALMFPDDMIPVIIGDLHTQIDNLINILTENTFLENLEQGKACLVILGDAVHSEVDGEMEDMATSMLIMDFIFKLKRTFPDQVFYIRGNHDSFSAEVSKSGIPQGLLWEKQLLDTRGKRYKEEMKRFYDQIPYVVLSKYFVACHASPPGRKINLEELINANAHESPKLVFQLILNRLKRPGYPAGYTESDVKRFRKGLDLKSDIPFIVAHNPLSQSESIWLNVGDIENHHIIFSGKQHCIGVFIRVGKHMVPLLYHTEPLVDMINALDD
ncbi:MAG: metallophosphoesterase [Gammaproteobacteria bacterium]|nr:metallophosphoesterase [Gammaproteobacteria bacterium]